MTSHIALSAIGPTWNGVDGWLGAYPSPRKRARTDLEPKFDDVPMNMTSRTSETLTQKERDGSTEKYGEVWEIWDAVSKKRIFVAKGMDSVLEEKDDPFKLDKFFPCPRPAYATLTNEDLFPVPDYLQYLDLADELGHDLLAHPQADRGLATGGTIRCFCRGNREGS